MARPVIGLCTALERARWSVWDQAAMLLPRSYIAAVQRGGGLALMVPPDPELVEHPEELLARLDGLVLAGGADIDPGAYGADAHPETHGTVPERDRVEIALVRRALQDDVPVLGICRGMQLINVALGGTLHQHLPERLGHSEHRRAAGTFEGSEHEVRLAPGSLAARAAGEQRHVTKSHHHQGIDRVGEGLTVSGWSVLDELPEAIERRDRRFALGVQWHPEADERSRLMSSLVSAAARRG
ncbi:MAG TPA: gamma-glutamyl-gamma-aminobutyrate hydrolase family protein [Solirubrobacteraceae bacterium]|jgi:putative glutamine amidotransferase|nr:gamma-glutamyl-gamma-aminobutyrate hydrolase family protein [Solirubrobacteraceae bacterium]